MKYSISGIIIGLVSLLSSVSAGEWIRINQLGYLPESPKVAVFMSEGKAAVEEYVLVEVFTGEIVKRFDNPKKANTWGRMQSVYRLDFSDFKTEGTYVLRVGETMSPRFVIGNRIYDETADFILRDIYKISIYPSCGICDSNVAVLIRSNGTVAIFTMDISFITRREMANESTFGVVGMMRATSYNMSPHRLMLPIK